MADQSGNAMRPMPLQDLNALAAGVPDPVLGPTWYGPRALRGQLGRYPELLGAAQNVLSYPLRVIQRYRDQPFVMKEDQVRQFGPVIREIDKAGEYKSNGRESDRVEDRRFDSVWNY